MQFEISKGYSLIINQDKLLFHNDFTDFDSLKQANEVAYREALADLTADYRRIVAGKEADSLIEPIRVTPYNDDAEPQQLPRNKRFWFFSTEYTVSCKMYSAESKGSKDNLFIYQFQFTDKEADDNSQDDGYSFQVLIPATFKDVSMDVAGAIIKGIEKETKNTGDSIKYYLYDMISIADDIALDYINS